MSEPTISVSQPKICPICERSVDMIVDAKAVNISGVFYHGPCSVLQSTADRKAWLDAINAELAQLRDWANREQKRAELAEGELEQAREELDRESAAHLVTIDDRDTAQDALAETHRALGGDGEWVAKLYACEPGETGDLRIDVPVIAAQIFKEATDTQEHADWLEGENKAAEKSLSEAREELARLKDVVRDGVVLMRGTDAFNREPAAMIVRGWIGRAESALAVPEKPDHHE